MIACTHLVISQHAHEQYKARVDPDASDADIEASFRRSVKWKKGEPLPLRQQFWTHPNSLYSIDGDVLFVSVSKEPKKFLIVTVICDRMILGQGDSHLEN